jgi:hypothetical protein
VVDKPAAKAAKFGLLKNLNQPTSDTVPYGIFNVGNSKKHT